MKRLILFLILAAGFALPSCDNDEPKLFRINPNATVKIKPEPTVQKVFKAASSNSEHLTPIEIVKQAHHFRYIHNDIVWEAGFSAKDTISESPKLMFWAQYVISVDGTASLQEDMIAGTDLVLIKQSGSYPNYINDTIAYIPNSVLRAAETAIRKAYADKDIDECFRLFDGAYTFTPITGAEWRELKANGQN